MTAVAPSTGAPALELTHIVRRFGATVALRDASLVVPPGTLHALLGENGAGKSTLVHIAFGELLPDEGRVLVDGVEQHFASPSDAIYAGIGMVHQHFRLIPAMTVAENVALGRGGRWLALREVAEEIRALGEETGLKVDPDARVESLGVAAQQRVEIIKALSRGARILVLDEPTAVLAPSEATELLAWVQRYVRAGGAAVLITHKLREALTVADSVTVLRRGVTVLSAPVSAVDEGALVAAMVGEEGGGELGEELGGQLGEERGGERARELGSDRAGELGGERARERAWGAPPYKHDTADHPPIHHPSNAPRTTHTPPNNSHTFTPTHTPPTNSHTSTPTHAPSSAPAPTVIALDDASYRSPDGVQRLAPTTLRLRAGEVVGVAGVEGAGHHELLRIMAGRLAPTSGHVHLPAMVGFIPEDRHRDALALDRSLAENVALRGARERRGRMNWKAIGARTDALIAEHDVRGGSAHTRARTLSGGNQQKLVLARELDDAPTALVVESPTRGLDVRAGGAVVRRLRAARERGVAIVVYSSDLDELLALADRMLVVHAGQPREVARDREAIGRAMVGAT